MSVTVVLGSQFGDEGKGKLVDVLLASGEYKLVARCAGVVDGQHFDFHILPSGLLDPKATNLIGNGCVVHVPQFFKELRDLKAKGVDGDGRIFISDRAHVLFNLHRLVDALREAALGDAKVGTTGNGIGPCYSDKAARSGIRIAEIFNKEYVDKRLRALAKRYQNEFGDSLQYDVQKEIDEFDTYRTTLRPYVTDSIDVVCKAQENGTKILVEAANALCLDIDGGTYPFVTSSSAGLAGVFSGLLGIRPETVSTRIGVVKAYSTRVGAGPLPTEDFGHFGNELQSVGREFGTTTGRRRRCGAFDLVLLRHTTCINRYTSLNLTKLDVLDGLDEIPVATAYHCTAADGTVTTWRDRLPSDWQALDPQHCRVEYRMFPGWKTDISGCRQWNDLPAQARAYVEWIEKVAQVPIEWVGVGAGREAMIYRPRK